MYDRSGIDDGDTTYGVSDIPVPVEVNVCYARSCRNRGSEAVLTEIEELMASVGGKCPVYKVGCLGYCNEAPNALVRDGNPSVHLRIRSLEASASVVEKATGKRPVLTGRPNLEDLRAKRARKAAFDVGKWNMALQAGGAGATREEVEEVLARAGYPEGCGAAPNLAKALAALPPPTVIDNYAPWTLESATPVSKHSAIFRLSCKDRKRGTPHPRGSGRQPEPKTWHTTMLAQIGSNAEGPLPWVERDYTPISTAKEWESGQCELLVKVYPGGLASSWLNKKPPVVWLSKPAQTLSVPGLMEDPGGFRPGSVLLLLAGTGVVALPQILAHRDPIRKLGIATPSYKQLRVPIDLILSCREDDVLLIKQIAEWCREAGDTVGIRRFTLLLTSANTTQPIFPEASGGDAAEAELELQGLTILRERLGQRLVEEAYTRMEKPCRVVVSGPGGFNGVAREYLDKVVERTDEVTILSA